MALHPPAPLVAFKPPEHVSTKVDLKLIRAFHADRSVDVLRGPGHVDPRESIRQPDTIVREENAARGELVSAAYGVPWGDASEERSVVSSAVGIFEELAEIV